FSSSFSLEAAHRVPAALETGPVARISVRNDLRGNPVGRVSSRGKEDVFEQALSTPFHKYDHVCCVDFRFWRGATREHPPQWGCDRGATKPEPKSDATPLGGGSFWPRLRCSFLTDRRRVCSGARAEAPRASSGPKIPRRKRGRIYEMGYLVSNQRPVSWACNPSSIGLICP